MAGGGGGGGLLEQQPDGAEALQAKGGLWQELCVKRTWRYT